MRWCARAAHSWITRFFQEFTRKIEGATAEEAKRLKAAAKQILTVSERPRRRHENAPDSSCGVVERSCCRSRAPSPCCVRSSVTRRSVLYRFVSECAAGGAGGPERSGRSVAAHRYSCGGRRAGKCSAGRQIDQPVGRRRTSLRHGPGCCSKQGAGERRVLRYHRGDVCGIGGDGPGMRWRSVWTRLESSQDRVWDQLSPAGSDRRWPRAWPGAKDGEQICQ